MTDGYNSYRNDGSAIMADTIHDWHQMRGCIKNLRRKGLTFIPPVTRHSVSRPDRSVTCTKVSLKDAKMCATEEYGRGVKLTGRARKEALIIMC